MYSTNPPSRSRAAPVFGPAPARCWSGPATQLANWLGFFPAHIAERRYGIKVPILPAGRILYAPLGTPLVERDAAEPVIAAGLAHIAGNPALPDCCLLPLIAEDGPFRGGTRCGSPPHGNAV